MFLTDNGHRAQSTDGEEGQALVLVITMMVIMAGVLALLASSAIFGLSFTTQTRASVQSVAAAQAGIDSIAVSIMNGECEAVTTFGDFDVTAGTPAFAGTVYRMVDASSAYVVGCPADDDYAFKVVSTGYAATPGVNGNNFGDVETLEAEWITTVSPPRFEDAIRGDVYVGTAGIAGILAAAGDANVYTVGDFYCPAGITIEGSVVVAGDATWTQNSCVVTGDLYVGGDLEYNQSPGSTNNVGGDLVVVGNVVHSLGTSYGNFDSWANPNYISVGGSIRVGGLVEAYCNYVGHVATTNWAGYSAAFPTSCSSTNVGTRVEMRVPGLTVGEAKDFTVLTTASEPFASWTPLAWDTMTGVAPGTVSDGRQITGGMCKNHPWTQKAVINVTTDTVMDTTSECVNGVQLGQTSLTINLSADLAIFANYFLQGGNVTINSTDGQPHSLYLIDPAPATMTTCVAPVADPSSSAGGLLFSYGDWNQDSQIAVLGYTDGKFKSARSNFHFGGQVYSCSSVFESGFYLDFRRVGDVAVAGGLPDFEVNYIRPSG